MDLLPGKLSKDIEIEDVDKGSTMTTGDVKQRRLLRILVVGNFGEVIFYFGGPDKEAFGNSTHTVTLSNIRSVTRVARAWRL